VNAISNQRVATTLDITHPCANPCITGVDVVLADGFPFRFLVSAFRKSIWQSWPRTVGIGGVFLLLLVAGAEVGLLHHYNYPYGGKSACLPIMLNVLGLYASDHGGAFPNGGAGPREALSKLRSDYLPDYSYLAGLSGDRGLLEKQINGGLEITEDACSWVYWPGLRSDDNPDIALLWERRSGLAYNGARLHGHAVGFIGGYMHQVRDEDWEAFLKNQAQLREKAISERKTGSKP
jgi:hypothetical protein